MLYAAAFLQVLHIRCSKKNRCGVNTCGLLCTRRVIGVIGARHELLTGPDYNRLNANRHQTWVIDFFPCVYPFQAKSLTILRGTGMFSL